MSNMPVYKAVARAFAAEGVDTHFTLMGDGNVHWVTAMAEIEGMRTFHVRHEHSACAMAMGYHGATGKVGVASVTHGPGFTQLMTVLKEASSVGVPLVVFAGEVALGAKHHGQYIDQKPLAAAVDVQYIAAHSLARIYDNVREAFYIAKYKRRPVVLGFPYDLQKQAIPDLGGYHTSAAVIPKLAPLQPDPAELEVVASEILKAKCPIFLAGRGAIWSGAERAIEHLAERRRGFLTTTLPARGMFDHNPFSIGVSGGYCREIARKIGADADLVVAFGASVSHHTLDGGTMYPKARLVQIDVNPTGAHDGRGGADIIVKADAAVTAEMLDAILVDHDAPQANVRSAALKLHIAQDPADSFEYQIESGLVDPRAAIEELDRVIPKHYDNIGGSGHQSYFYSLMRGRKPKHYHDIKAFGSIGSGLARAIGVAAARQHGEVALFEGDGSLLMHIQELEMIRRHRLKLLICVFNDGAYGSEIHKMRADGIDDAEAKFGRTDFASIAKGFGLRGSTVTNIQQFRPLFDAYAAQDTAEIWNIHVSDQVVSPFMRRIAEHRAR